VDKTWTGFSKSGFILQDKYFLTFEIIDKNNFTMPLEVEVMTSKEKLVKKVWIKGKAKVSFELNDKPTKIILDPNEWMVNENKKYNVEGIRIEVNYPALTDGAS